MASRNMVSGHDRDGLELGLMILVVFSKLYDSGPQYTGQGKEAQRSWDDYFFNKRKHSEGKCLKKPLLQEK